MRPWLMFFIGAFFGGGFGFLVAASQGVTLDGHDHSDHAAHGGHNAQAGHGQISLPAGQDAPTLSATLIPDAKSGWNLQLQTTNFRFAPAAVNKAHVPGEGHAHVYVDGAKLARLYSPWLHIPTLEPGAEVKVELNANSHEALMVGNAPLAQVLTVNVE